MKKKIILISISFVLVILSIFLLFTKLNNKVNVEDFNNDTSIKKDNHTTNSKDPITIKDIKDNKETNTKEETNKNTSNNNVPTPIITYSCPDGFELQGEQCIQHIAANHICANGMTSIDKGCINFNEGIKSPDGNCPNGYHGLAMINFGKEDEYYCYLIHEISFSCPDGYNLNNTTCTKTIPATRN